MQSKNTIITVIIVIVIIALIIIIARRTDDIAVIEKNRTQIVEHMQVIGSLAFDYYSSEIDDVERGTFEGFTLPEEYAHTDFGSFELTTINQQSVTIQAVSVYEYGVVEAKIDSSGQLIDWSYTGYFDTIPGKYGLKP